MFERNLVRHAFQPIDPEKGQLSSLGWVNIRQMLDSRLTLEKVLFGNTLLLSLRVDRLAINQKLFRATFAQELAKLIRDKAKGQLSREERAVLEDKVRMDLIRRTQPNTAVYEVAWLLQEGLVFFGATGDKLGMQFQDLFAETFQVTLESMFPALRAKTWADRQGLGQELLEILPSPFSPEAPVDVVEVLPSEE
jgi:hypothetical protein